MIRKISHGLVFSGLMLSGFAQAALPDNIQLQRDTLRSLTLMMQLQAEGMHALHRQELQQDVQQVQQALQRAGHSDSDYTKTLAHTLDAHDSGQPPTGEDIGQLHEQALSMLDRWHSPDTDTLYMPLLMTEYLAMRYVFSSYIGNPATAAHEPGRYYTTNTNDLLLQLDQRLTNTLATTDNHGLAARWAMLHLALADTHEGWTRTRSGKAFTPIVVIRNARVFSNQLAQLLDNPQQVGSQ